MFMTCFLQKSKNFIALNFGYYLAPILRIDIPPLFTAVYGQSTIPLNLSLIFVSAKRLHHHFSNYVDAITGHHRGVCLRIHHSSLLDYHFPFSQGNAHGAHQFWRRHDKPFGATFPQEVPSPNRFLYNMRLYLHNTFDQWSQCRGKQPHQVCNAHLRY